MAPPAHNFYPSYSTHSTIHAESLSLWTVNMDSDGKYTLEARPMTDAKQLRYDRAYIRMAVEWAKLSHCDRKKVGALIVKNHMLISDGYNGTPSGFENCCEDEAGATKWYVLHAEANAIMKVARSTNDMSGATLYITLSPCTECSKLIHQSGIVRVVYLDSYKDCSGLDFLREAGVIVEQLQDLESV